MCEDLTVVMARAKATAQAGGSTGGTSTGFAKLDWWTAGLHPSNLIVLAALTGMGKTALAANIAANVARADTGAVVVFSMEMGRLEMAARLSASEVELDLRRLTGGELSEHELQRLDQAQEGLQAVGRNILLDVSGRVTAATIRTHLRRIARRQAIALVIVDYLQLCGTSAKAESQYVRTAMISADLKAIAVDFDVPVLALSQLSREAARRGGEPKLSDLRDSGTIEQDANVVVFIHRDQGSNPNTDTDASIIVAKNRNGPIGKCTMRWSPKSVRFVEEPDVQPSQMGD
jgi:replicative DNA helicase